MIKLNCVTGVIFGNEADFLQICEHQAHISSQMPYSVNNMGGI